MNTRVSTLHRISVFVEIAVLFQKCTEKCTANLCTSKDFYGPLSIKLFVIFIQLQHSYNQRIIVDNLLHIIITDNWIQDLSIQPIWLSQLR